MKEGQIQAVDTLTKLLKPIKNKVWEMECTKTELPVLKKKGKVSNTKITGNNIILRLVADEKPCGNAVNVDGNLQDLYLYVFDTVSE